MLDDGGFMTTDEIVIAIDGEIARLLKVKALLTGADLPIKRGPGRPAGTSAQKKVASLKAEVTGKPEKRRILSAEARARIAAAQKARWAKSKRAAKKAARESAPLAKKSGAVKPHA
jgi:hypothetical protein